MNENRNEINIPGSTRCLNHSGTAPEINQTLSVGWMDKRMYGCTGWIYGWTDGCMDGWMDAWMDGCMDGCMDAWMDGCMHACMHGRSNDGRVDEWWIDR